MITTAFDRLMIKTRIEMGYFPQYIYKDGAGWCVPLMSENRVIHGLRLAFVIKPKKK